MGVGPESIEYEIISLGDSKGFVKLGYNMERERISDPSSTGLAVYTLVSPLFFLFRIYSVST